MIDIIRFRELMVELQVKVNQKSEDKIDSCFLAVKEEHMVKKLKDKTGVLLCANYPDAEGDNKNKDNWQEDNLVILFICEKVASGSQTDEEELLHYARLQRIMCILKDVIRQDEYCNRLSMPGVLQRYGNYNGMDRYNGIHTDRFRKLRIEFFHWKRFACIIFGYGRR